MGYLTISRAYKQTLLRAYYKSRYLCSSFPYPLGTEAAMAETTLGAIHGEPVNLTYDGDVLSWTKVYELPDGRGIPSKGSFTSSNILTLIRTPGTEVRYTIYSTSILEDSDPSAAVPDVKLVVTNVNNPPADFIARHMFQGLPQYLRLIPEDIHIIISSKSGVGKADSFFEEVVKPLLEGVGLEGSHYQVLETQSSESVYDFGSKRLKEKACRSVKQTVMLLSGDGGVSDLLNGLGGAERMRFVLPILFSLSFLSRVLFLDIILFYTRTIGIFSLFLTLPQHIRSSNHYHISPRHRQRPLSLHPQTLSTIPLATSHWAPLSPLRRSTSTSTLHRRILERDPHSPFLLTPTTRDTAPQPSYLRRHSRILRFPLHTSSRLGYT